MSDASLQRSLLVTAKADNEVCLWLSSSEQFHLEMGKPRGMILR